MGLHEPTTHMLNGREIKLDWRLRHDPLSMQYTVARKLNMSKPLRSRRWTKRVVLDQNVYNCKICRQKGACVGYSGLYTMLTTPRAKVPITPPGITDRENLDMLAHAYYHGAQRYDQWKGGFEAYEGSSVLGFMQYAKATGLINSYLWCRTIDEILVALSNYGPLQIGIDWDNNMFEPDGNGIIHTGGGEAGGHAIELIGIDVPNRLVEIPNSWGLVYGRLGTVWMSWDDLQTRIDLRGEFALPRKPLLGRNKVLA